MILAFFSMFYGTYFYLYIIKTNPNSQTSKCLPIDLRGLMSYWVCSWCVVFSTLFATFSIKLVPVSIFAIFFNLKPVLVIFFGFCAGQETISLKKILLIFISFLGTGLIVDSQFFVDYYEKFFKTKIDTSDNNTSSLKFGTHFEVWLTIRIRLLSRLFFRFHVDGWQRIYNRFHQEIR